MCAIFYVYPFTGVKNMLLSIPFEGSCMNYTLPVWVNSTKENKCFHNGWFALFSIPNCCRYFGIWKGQNSQSHMNVGATTCYWICEPLLVAVGIRTGKVGRQRPGSWYRRELCEIHPANLVNQNG